MLLELSIEVLEIGSFELMALFASGDFGFNFLTEDDVPGTDPREDPGVAELEQDLANAESEQVQGRRGPSKAVQASQTKSIQANRRRKRKKT